MPVDRGPAGGGAGAYKWVRDWHENNYREWAESVHNNGRDRYPKHHVLEKLRAGLPVTVGATFLPARFGGVPAPASHREARATEYWRRQHEAVEVGPDDTVRPADDDSDIYAEFMDL